MNIYACIYVYLVMEAMTLIMANLFTLVAYDPNFQTELWFGAREDASWCCDGSGRTGVWYAVSAGRFRWVQVCKEWRTAVKHCTNEWMIIFFIPLLWRRRGHTVLALCVCLFVVLSVCLLVTKILKHFSQQPFITDASNFTHNLFMYAIRSDLFLYHSYVNFLLNVNFAFFVYSH